MIVFVVQSDEINQRQNVFFCEYENKRCLTICVNSEYMVIAPASGTGPSFWLAEFCVVASLSIAM